MGAGVTFLKLVSLNVEYIMSTYDELKSSTGTVKFPVSVLGVTIDKFKANTVMVSVSVPLDL